MRIYFTVLVVTLVTGCGAETAAEKKSLAALPPGQFICPPSSTSAEDTVCAAVYDPVCATTAQGSKTYSNSCKACLEPDVGHYKKGACEDS
jgi:hypothetical protein